MRKAFTIAALAFALAGCAALQDHSAPEYQQAAPLDNPDGSLTTIAGPDTAVVDLSGNLKFSDGDVERTHSVLKYDQPAGTPDACLFHAEYANPIGMVVKEPQVSQPCDGKRPASFRIGGIDATFVAHLHHVVYKGTPVTLLEMSKYDVPEYIRVVY
jgi:hypothetical protein